MGNIRHLYPGGNTCYGFYSLYDHILSPDAVRKIILKGGPGTGKSTLMKNLGNAYSEKGHNVEFHWCSSDNDSLDGVVIDSKLCIIDGTAPHVVDPIYPGAWDEIINLGAYWDEKKLQANKEEIVNISTDISNCFKRAYLRLRESKLAFQEWESYFEEAEDKLAINKNVLALSGEFISNAKGKSAAQRHLYAAAITPGGVISKVDSLINKECNIFAVKGSPGTGVQKIFKHIRQSLELKGLYAEVFHCPFDPKKIDLIFIPDSNLAIINLSDIIVNYESYLQQRKYKRLLDFKQFIDSKITDLYAKRISSARERFETGLRDAVSCIKKAKSYHDELENYFIPAMDFNQISELKTQIEGRIDDVLER